MATTNTMVADLLRQYAAALSVEGANRFKLKAYRRAAETIEGLDRDVAHMVHTDEDLTELPGIGAAISEMIVEIVRERKLPRLDRAIAKLPPEQVELASRPALDPKKVSRIYKKLGIQSLDELRKVLDAGTIGKLFGSRLEYHVRHGLDERPRSLLWSVEGVAERLEQTLRSLPGVANASVVGSVRRRQDTVGDMNFLLAAKNAPTIFKRFGEVGGVLSSEIRSRVERIFRLSSGLIATIHITEPANWGLELIRATGSPQHWAELEIRAAKLKKPLDVTWSGVARENDIYEGLDLSFVQPELREGRGEVFAAAHGKLPRLIESSDIRGDLHMHTTASDGANSIAEMAAAAQKKGYEYIAITDHSQSLKITNGLSEDRLAEHIRNIDQINETLRGFRILKSAEVDILENGRLDYSNAMLKQLDLTICSIHSRFSLNREQQTERILRAMDNRYFTILGHATGRLLLQRPGYELDMERIVEHAHENGCFFEINSSPNRLDLSDEHAKRAKDCGVKIAVNTDAHSVRELEFMSAGINQARRGWLAASDVLNTRPLKTLIPLFRR